MSTVAEPEGDGPMSGRARVYVDMVGDLFHPGHVELLRRARTFGEWLVVGVLSDEVAGAYKRRPVMTMEERATMVGACRYVDEVLPDAPAVVTAAFMRAHDLAIVVHGDDLSEAAVTEVFGDVVAADRLRLVPYTSGISTTDLIRRVEERNR